MQDNRSLPLGVYSPVVTPFNDDLTVNSDKLINQCKWLLSQDVGLAIFGTNSEANSLSVDEKIFLLDKLIDHGVAPDKLMPGTGCCAITDTIKLTKHAVKLGCSGVLMLPPFYYKTVDDALNATTSNAPEPTIICLAETHPGQIHFHNVFRLTQHWPLTRIISVGSCLSDGRRRSGPVVDGILEVPWHDLPSRMKVWLQRIDSGAPSSLTYPPTLRRDERWLADAKETQPFHETSNQKMSLNRSFR